MVSKWLNDLETLVDSKRQRLDNDGNGLKRKWKEEKEKNDT
jgi:hypothetical protein